MKKIVSLILIICTLISSAVVASAAKIGDVIGVVYHTDIVAYINHYAIPSYAANGTSVVVAEDLRKFGFDVTWDEDSRSLSISRSTMVYPNEMNFTKSETPNTKFANLLYTDIKVYADGILIPSYSINGYTMIPMESLTMFGLCEWVPHQRAIKLWIEGMNVRDGRQKLKHKLTIEEAGEKVIAWRGAGDLGTWMDGKPNYLVYNNSYIVDGKEYYEFIVRGYVDGHSTTLDWIVIAADDSEIFNGRIWNGEIDYWGNADITWYIDENIDSFLVAHPELTFDGAGYHGKSKNGEIYVYFDFDTRLINEISINGDCGFSCYGIENGMSIEELENEVCVMFEIPLLKVESEVDGGLYNAYKNTISGNILFAGASDGETIDEMTLIKG